MLNAAKYSINKEVEMSMKYGEVFREVFEKANEIYDLDLNMRNVDVSYDLGGRTLGRAHKKHCEYEGDYVYSIQLNPHYVEAATEEDIRDTIIHEIAHVIAWMKPELGAKNHNRYWKVICWKLGGSGERTGHIPEGANIPARRKVTRVEYNVPGYGVVKITKTRHTKIMKGARYRLKGNYPLDKRHFVRIL